MVHQLKAALRKEMLARRDALSPADIQALSGRIQNGLFRRPRFQEAKVVAFYAPIGKEVDTRPMIEAAAGDGREVLLPATDHQITFYKFKSFQDLVPGKFGIPEPKSREPEDCLQP